MPETITTTIDKILWFVVMPVLFIMLACIIRYAHFKIFAEKNEQSELEIKFLAITATMLSLILLMFIIPYKTKQVPVDLNNGNYAIGEYGKDYRAILDRTTGQVYQIATDDMFRIDGCLDYQAYITTESNKITFVLISFVGEKDKVITVYCK